MGFKVWSMGLRFRGFGFRVRSTGLGFRDYMDLGLQGLGIIRFKD